VRAFVTGSEGFVGPYLSELLLQEGFDVYGTYLEKPDAIADINYIKLDVTNRGDVFEAVSKLKPDFIFHLAGFSSVKASWSNPDLCRKINVDGTRNLLDAVVNAKINPRILVVSSAEVYGTPQYTPITEEHLLNPESPYAESRLQQEQLTLEYDLDVVVSRSFNHTGPRQPPDFVVPDFARQIALIEKGVQKPVLEVGNLDAVRDFTDVRDMVRAYVMALKKCQPGVYNICSGVGYSIQEMLELLLSLSDKEIAFKQIPDKTRSLGVPVLVGDCSKFKRSSSWTPSFPMKKTLSDCLDYWRQTI